MKITIPNLGDIDEVEVIELCVAVGDRVEENDPLVVIESDKASMEIPSTIAGVVKSLDVAVGDVVGEGHQVAEIAADEAQRSAPAEPTDDAEPAGPPPAEPKPGAPAGQLREIEVLVPDIGDAKDVVVIEVAVREGDVVAVDDLLVVLESDKASMEITAEHAGTVTKVAVSVDQEVDKGTHIATLAVAADEPDAEAIEVAPADVRASTSTAGPVQQESAASATSGEEADAGAARIYAGPAVRRLARELGVNLSDVSGTGNRGRITKDDVKAFVKSRMTAPDATSGGGLPRVAEIDFARFGETELAELSRIRQRGADNLHRSWVNLPHVTQHDEADVTDLETFRRSLREEADSRGVKLTPLAFIIKAVCAVLREQPVFNSSLHPGGKQLVMKKYINIGMAVDTPEGLVVPVIRGADAKNIWELSAEIAELAAKARDRKLGMDDLQGGTFSVSSLGALGGTGFTPIINAPEVAILGVGRMQTKPLWDGAEFQPRQVLPLSLSYDHRVVNGADGGRFMLALTNILSDIRRLAL